MSFVLCFPFVWTFFEFLVLLVVGSLLGCHVNVGRGRGGVGSSRSRSSISGSSSRPVAVVVDQHKSCLFEWPICDEVCEYIF